MDKLEDKVKSLQKDLDPLLKRYNLQIGGLPHFPIYKILPVEVELALKILEKHGVQYVAAFKEVKNAKS